MRLRRITEISREVPAVPVTVPADTPAVVDAEGNMVFAREWVRARCRLCGDERHIPAHLATDVTPGADGVYIGACGQCVYGETASFFRPRTFRQRLRRLRAWWLR